MITAAELDGMLAAGMTAEQVLQVVRVQLVTAETRAVRVRAQTAERTAKWRARKRDASQQGGDGGDASHASHHSQNIVSIEDFKASVDDDDKIAPKDSYLLTSTEDSLRKKKEGVARARGGDASRDRGTRLPDEWAPDADGSIMAAQQLGPERYLTELAKFRDYWRAQPGVRGRKLDWNATFRNWIRNAGTPRNGGNGHGRKRTVSEVADAFIAELDDKIRREEAEAGDGASQSSLGLLPPRQSS